MSLSLAQICELPYFKAIKQVEQDKVKQNYELADEEAREALSLHLAKANEYFVHLRDEKDPVAKKQYFVNALQTGVASLKNRVTMLKSKAFAQVEKNEKLDAEDDLLENLNNIK